nr:TIGR03279 family radical SAM protein [Prochlorococcus sp. MIT 1223]
MKTHASQSNLKPALVESVEPGSIGEDLGIQPGDKILRINGIRPRDLIDYNFLVSEEEIKIEVIDKNEKLHQVEFEKDADDGLGIIFKEALFDGLKQCNNNCPFCFIDQQPPGKRSSLYLKDDDYRLSFLYGSYLTLTNLSKEDWQRIESQNLSPLFVSVHATDPSLRTKLLKNQKAALIMEQLNWFSKRNLQIHAQVVVCPGINDGKFLDKTLSDLFQFAKGDWPAILSIAVVPVGLTRFRPDNDGLTPVTQECAEKTIFQVESLQKEFKNEIGSRFAWLSDEWYLIANKKLPIRKDYEDLPQEENGVGSIRSFLEKLDCATSSLPRKIPHKRSISWVVGKMVKNAFYEAEKKLNSIENLSVNLYGLPSPYWGQEQVVTGLLTGKDILEGLSSKNLGDQLLVPSVMLKEDKPVFLDDMTIEEVSQSLRVPINIVHSAEDIVNAALGTELLTRK